MTDTPQDIQFPNSTRRVPIANSEPGPAIGVGVHLGAPLSYGERLAKLDAAAAAVPPSDVSNGRRYSRDGWVWDPKIGWDKDDAGDQDERFARYERLQRLADFDRQIKAASDDELSGLEAEAFQNRVERNAT